VLVGGGGGGGLWFLGGCWGRKRKWFWSGTQFGKKERPRALKRKPVLEFSHVGEGEKGCVKPRKRTQTTTGGRENRIVLFRVPHPRLKRNTVPQ